MCEPEQLISASRGVVEAPAGCGKTRLIAEAVACHAPGRQLILTHSHAGVNAIRSYLQGFGAGPAQFRLATIDGWSLQYCTSYPTLSHGAALEPTSSQDWDSVRLGAASVLGSSAVRAVVKATYAGVLVDEYQDCTSSQHALVQALAAILPTRVLGDPLQGIFDFRENSPVNWEQDVLPAFVPLPPLSIPWRWRQSAPALGEWLGRVRELLVAGQPIDLREAPQDHVGWTRLLPAQAPRQQYTACISEVSSNQSVVAIQKWPHQCHELASRLGGTFLCAERVDCPDLLEAAERMDGSADLDRVRIAVEYAADCISGVKTQAPTLCRALVAGRVPEPGRCRVNVDLLRLAESACTSGRLIDLIALLDGIEKLPGVHVYRWEPLWDLKRAIGMVARGESESIREAAWQARDLRRRLGGKSPHRVLGTTKLVKGLQFDTAVVLNADDLEKRDLYVALTRASSRLVILSANPVLQPSG